MDAKEAMKLLGQRAKAASRQLMITGSAAKDRALRQIAEDLLIHQEEILAANRQDLDNGEANGIRPVMLDRLRLTKERLESIAASVREVAALPDPVGEVLDGSVRPNGLEIQKVRVPMGVIGIIYESRPNVTVDAAALCLKSGNACILRGGKEAIATNTALAHVMAGPWKRRDCLGILCCWWRILPGSVPGR